MKTHLPSLAGLALVLAITTAAGSAQAQDGQPTLSFKKGQAIDFLFLNNKPDTREMLQDYFKTVFPLVKDAGYQPLPGFNIVESPTQGNYHPSHLAIASWNSVASRAQAMASIEENVADFHARRRDIWSSFAITVYEMDRDYSMPIDTAKTYVLTAYWQKPGESFGDFKGQWLGTTKRAGGDVVLQLEDGFSPFGYRYNPAYLAITEWQNRAAFDAFQSENLAMDHAAVDHVNQFVLAPVVKK